MELSVRDWMIIVGVLLIVAVLADGFRRVRNERRGRIRMSLNKQFLNSSNEESLYNSELPGGPARPVGRGRPVPIKNDSELDTKQYEDTFCAPDLQLDQDVPMLMESVCADPIDDYVDAQEDGLPNSNVQQSDVTSGDTQHGDVFSEDAQQAGPSLSSDDDTSSLEPSYSDIKVTGTPDDNSSGVYVDSQLDADDDNGDREIIVINVVAKEDYFKGPDLLHILLACDVRFGNMNIFHRHEKANGSGAVQFSVANSVEPGDFDLENIEQFTTPGLCFFMSVPGPQNPIEAFDCLVETAQCLAKNLNGELRDESRSVMTAQTLAHCRARLVEFERRQLTQHA